MIVPHPQLNRIQKKKRPIILGGVFGGICVLCVIGVVIFVVLSQRSASNNNNNANNNANNNNVGRQYSTTLADRPAAPLPPGVEASSVYGALELSAGDDDDARQRPSAQIGHYAKVTVGVYDTAPPDPRSAYAAPPSRDDSYVDIDTSAY
jgi:hypothetical protein